MAKKSIIAREHKREKLIARYAVKRAALKELIRNPKTEDADRFAAKQKLHAMPRDASPVRARRRCRLTGRPHGVYRKFGLSRNMLRKLTMSGQVPGLRKASW